MAARLTDEERALRRITEASWQRTVIGLARAHGWRFYHPPRAGIRAGGTVRHTVAGFPDLVMVRGPRIVFAELKRQTGTVTPQQQGWLDDLRRASVEVYVFRPSDLPEVRRVLSRRAEDGAA